MVNPSYLLQNRYRIVRQIGGGGMGEVYLAEDTRLPGRRCAIKEMTLVQVLPQDRNWTISAFKQEAQMLAFLRHPGLTSVTDFFTEGGNWYLVMDYVEGETLETWLQRSPEGKLSLPAALDIVRQLCDVLEYLHSQNPPVIFRDLKPGNVMLTPQGQIKLIDFGIARFFKPGKGSDTVNLGTPGYAAPEQGGRGQTDARSDLYSLGAMLHQLLTGYDPTMTPFNIPPARTLDPAIPPSVDAVIQRAMQMSPDARFMNVGELRQALFAPAVPPPPRPASLIAVAVAGVFLIALIGVAVVKTLVSPPRAISPRVSAVATVSLTASSTSLAVSGLSAAVPVPSSTPTPTPEPSPTPTLVPPTPTFAIESGRIAFASDRDGTSHIYTVNGDGTSLRKLTEGYWYDYSPTWSLDGRRILFVSNREGPDTDGLYIMNANGTSLTRLSPHGGRDETPAWSPDGQRILFASNRTGNWEIYEMNQNGSNKVQITNHRAKDWFPVPSPDGARIAFVSDRDGSEDIYVMNKNGTEIRRLTTLPNAQQKSVDWSRDGLWIAFHASFAGGGDRIYLIHPDGTGLTLLVSRGGYPCWLPDSGRLIFDSDRSGTGNIYVTDITGVTVKQLTFGDKWDWSASFYSPLAALYAPTPTSALREIEFQVVPLGSIGNASLAPNYASPLTGKQVLDGIPFELDGRAFKSQAQPAPDNAYPADTAIDVKIPRVERVYVLITAGNGYTQWQGKTVGQITLVFDTAPPVETALILGMNLREWHAADNIIYSAPGVRQVWQKAITGRPDLTGTMDMLTIEVPADRRSATLTRIEFHDSSASTVRSLDPALTVSGVTVAHR